MQKVRRLDQNRIPHFNAKRPPLPIEQSTGDGLSSNGSAVTPKWADIERDGELSYARQGIQQRVIRRLRRGQFNIQAELDLHGNTVPQARTHLSQFLLQAHQSDWRCVRVIHGKGHGSYNQTPVIKRHVNGWLRQHKEVLAFCPAQPADGGAGAVYVLLKSQASKS